MTECRWCGETHLKGVCPKVKAIEFAEDGETVRRVEFMTPADLGPMLSISQIPLSPATNILPPYPTPIWQSPWSQHN